MDCEILFQFKAKHCHVLCRNVILRPCIKKGIVGEPDGSKDYQQGQGVLIVLDDAKQASL